MKNGNQATMHVSIATKLQLSIIIVSISMGCGEVCGGKGGGSAPLAWQTVGAGFARSGLTILGGFGDSNS